MKNIWRIYSAFTIFKDFCSCNLNYDIINSLLSCQCFNSILCVFHFHKALDEEYLKVDAQFGGVDQRKIFTLAEKVHLYVLWSYFAPVIPIHYGPDLLKACSSSNPLLDLPKAWSEKIAIKMHRHSIFIIISFHFRC